MALHFYYVPLPFTLTIYPALNTGSQKHHSAMLLTFPENKLLSIS